MRGWMLPTALAAAVLAGAPGCAPVPEIGGAVPATGDGRSLSPALDELLDLSSDSPRGDMFEVWVCDVPADTLDPTYYSAPLRLPLDPSSLATVLEEHIPKYFRELSSSAYEPSFVAGQTHRMTATESPEQCLDAAVRASDPASTAVLAIATAEHDPAAHGGFARAGDPCDAGPCAASATGRGIYLGASDFHPDWGAVPALDLLEHEVGHLLGWPHSGGPDADDYDSALDVMSNSAAPREDDPDRRHAQDTLVVNKVASGWIAPDRVLVAEPAASTASVQLSAASSADGATVLILPVDADRFLTVEWLVAEGLNAHLPHDGAVVTLVDLSGSACAGSDSCTSAAPARTHRTLSGTPPFTDLLTGDGPSWSGHGWTVEVDGAHPGLIHATKSD